MVEINPILYLGHDTINILEYPKYSFCTKVKMDKTFLFVAQNGVIKRTGAHTSVNNSIALGRAIHNEDYYYGNVVLDELLFFNEVLNETFISQLASGTE